MNGTVFTQLFGPVTCMLTKIFFNFLQAFKEEEKEYADLKKNLRVSIRDMRRTVSSIIQSKRESIYITSKLP